MSFILHDRGSGPHSALRGSLQLHSIPTKRKFLQRWIPQTHENKDVECTLRFENLPDVILFKIFSYLYIGDLCRAGRVCRRWRKLTRSPCLWRCVDAADMQMTSYQVQKLVPILPECVKYLRICSLSTQQRIPFLNPATALQIRERCPQLKTLVIESAFVAKHINFTDITVEDLPQKLSILSLRKSFFHTDQFFCSVSHPTVPKIKVLDCSSCWCVHNDDILFFSRLTDLQEIYLAGCPVSDAGVAPLLKAVEHLKVLDLEHTNVGLQTMEALSTSCNYLQKLYLGHTQVADKHFVQTLETGSLRSLQELCLRKTFISCIGLRYIVTMLRSLRYLNASICHITTDCASELKSYVTVRNRLKIDYQNEWERAEYCDHFLLRKKILQS